MYLFNVVMYTYMLWMYFNFLYLLEGIYTLKVACIQQLASAYMLSSLVLPYEDGMYSRCVTYDVTYTLWMYFIFPHLEGIFYFKGGVHTMTSKQIHTIICISM